MQIDMAGRSACKTSILTIHNGTLVGYRSIKNWWKYTYKIISFVNEWCVMCTWYKGDNSFWKWLHTTEKSLNYTVRWID